MRRGLFTLLIILTVSGSVSAYEQDANADTPHPGVILNPQELSTVLSHGPWPPAARNDPANRVSGNKTAIELGRQLFFSPLLSADKKTSCASCHSPEHAFASGTAIDDGKFTLDRNTQSLINVKFHRWFGWDGRNDNLWAQSIRPITLSAEMNLPAEAIREVADHTAFKQSYNTLFGDTAQQDDTLILVNIGKALAAFQETLISDRTTFDDFRDAVAEQDWQAAAHYPKTAQRGLSLFMDRGRCIFCHSGALFSNGEFHDAGVPYFIRPGVVDAGRHLGIEALKTSAFTLDGDYTDDPDKTGAWAVKKVARLHANFGAFRVPSLRGVANTAPYMHNGSLATLEAVVEHYSDIDMERLHVDGEAILRPLGLTDEEISDLVAFLESL
uniref:Cytochrome c551 peroxidase (EC) n=1 Tax=uncultured Thiotrichaceae bacterium TaxID=298394 RepID=A0A6S6THA6_9GAMM|nr:MAG: Cytochrome c551 peroxidase (EC [uncultured Thiotrichaceae bacterium]